MIFLILGFITAEILKVKYFDINDKQIKQNIFNRRKFRLNIDKYNFVFSNGSKNYISDPCYFTLVNDVSFGYFHVCDKIKGLVCNSLECLQLAAIKQSNPNSLNIKKYPLSKVLVKTRDFYKSGITILSTKLSDDGLIVKNEIRLIEKRILELKIAIINEYDRYLVLNKKAYEETLSIFNLTRKIINSLKFDDFSIDIIKSIILNRTRSNLIKKDTEDPLGVLESKLSKFKGTNNKLYDSDLVILLTNDKEGISYFNGLEDKDTKYIIVNLDPDDSIFYKSKVIVHEILHTLGSLHDREGNGFLMDSKFLNKNERTILLSKKSRKDIEKFVKKNEKLLFKKKTF